MQQEIVVANKYLQLHHARAYSSGSPPQADARIWDRLAEFLFDFFQPTQDVKEDVGSCDIRPMNSFTA